jgi:hypothetical protein
MEMEDVEGVFAEEELAEMVDAPGSYGDEPPWGDDDDFPAVICAREMALLGATTAGTAALTTSTIHTRSRIMEPGSWN